jgi:hypothetical protein
MFMSSTTATAFATADETLTPAHLDRARLFLQQTQSGIEGAMKGLSEAQWTFKPAPDRWSIAEIVEHIAIVQERVLGQILPALADAPGPQSDYDREAVDSIVIHQFPTRLAKFSAPEFVLPKGGLEQAEALRRLAANYAGFAVYLASATDMRSHALESRPLAAVTNGKYTVMDGYQWVLAAAAHMERHTRQILEVKAELAFPDK